MAFRLTIGESYEFSKFVFSRIGKGDNTMKGFKTESKPSLSPSNAKRWRFKAQQANMKGLMKEIINNYEGNNQWEHVSLQRIISNKAKKIDLNMWQQQGVQQCLHVLAKQQWKLERRMNVFLVSLSKMRFHHFSSIGNLYKTSSSESIPLWKSFVDIHLKM